jgi:hypothetical protein
MDQQSKTPEAVRETAPSIASRARLPWNTPRLTLLSGQATAAGIRAIKVEGVDLGITYRPS